MRLCPTQPARAWLTCALLALLCARCNCLASTRSDQCTTDDQCPADYRCDPVDRLCHATAGGSDATLDDRNGTDAAAADHVRTDVSDPDRGGADSSSVDRDAGRHDATARDATAHDAIRYDAITRDSTVHDVVGVDATGLERNAADAAVVTVDGGGWDRSVEGYNIVFVSSTSYTPRELGGHAGADAICQQLAATAGWSGTFVAWISTSTLSAFGKLGSASGFVRADGLPFADTATDIKSALIAYPLRSDENGVDIGMDTVGLGPPVMTGTDASGQAEINFNCQDWTQYSGPDVYRAGWASAGGVEWTAGSIAICNAPGRLYCFETDHVRPLAAFAQSGRRAFVSDSTFLPSGGIAAADVLCTHDAAVAGLVGSYRALLADVDRTAASHMDPAGAPWVRVDGVLIAWTVAELLAGHWLAPINRHANGSPQSYVNVWTGAPAPDAPGTASSTCEGWAGSQNDQGTVGHVNFSNGAGFSYTSSPCTNEFRVYCLEQ